MLISVPGRGDTEREYDYRVAPLGHLEPALAAAYANGWLVISIGDGSFLAKCHALNDGIR